MGLAMSDSDATSRLVSLVKSMLAATLADRLQWETTDAQGTFLVARPQGSATIRSVDGDGNAPFEFSILAQDGEVIERLKEDRHLEAPWDEDLSNLYDAARRSAYDIDSTIDKWVNDISNLERGDEPPF